MKISHSLIIVLATIISLIAMTGGLGIIANQQLAGSFEELVDYEIRVDAAAEASSYAKRAEGHLFLYLTLENEVDREKFHTRHASLNEQIIV